MLQRSVAVFLSCAAVLATASTARAQSTQLANLLPNLILSDITLAAPAPGNLSHEAHFHASNASSAAPFLFNQQLIAQMATVPNGSPAGGFAFTFDASTGTFQRATNSFGPAYADRALTNGRKKLTFGANYQYASYSSFNGADLKNGDVAFYLTHQQIPGDPFFEGDVVKAALRLDVTNSTTSFFANYGLTDALDVAVQVPIVHVSMKADVDATILRLATAGSSLSTIHQFPGGGTTATFSDSGSATGVGDMVVRTKYRFLSSAGGGLAAGVDVHLPTGNADDLLGRGSAAATWSLIGSSTNGRLGPHFNLGFTNSGTSDTLTLDVKKEFDYKFGTEYEASPKVTIAADLLGRRLIDSGLLQLSDVTHRYTSEAGVPGSATFAEYVSKSGSLNMTDLALGAKFNVTGNLLLNANVRIALTDSGVTSRVTPAIGFDYTF